MGERLFLLYHGENASAAKGKNVSVTKSLRSLGKECMMLRKREKRFNRQFETILT